VEARKTADRAGKVRLLTLADLDHRTTAARRAHDLIESIHTDLGGVDRLATGEQQIVQRAALIGTMAEDVEARWLAGQSIDPNILCVLANAQRRLFETLGLSRRSKDVTLSEYLAASEVDAE
jgi:hypothetical protein